MSARFGARVLVLVLSTVATACAEPSDDSVAGEQHALEAAAFGSCDYMNPFSQLPECATFSGGGWTLADATAYCDNRVGGTQGTLTVGGACSIAEPIGRCLENPGQPTEVFTTYTGSAADCDTTENACVSFVGGIWEAEAGGPCDSGAPPDTGLEDEALAAMLSNPLATVDPECINDTCVAELAAASQFIEFRPTTPRALPARRTAASVGVVIYGGNLDPRAYAPAAQAFAAAGYFAAIVPFPGDLALVDPARANLVRAAHPEIERWVVVGHSVGGVAAAAHLAAQPDDYRGLALWAAVPADGVDLSAQRRLRVLSLYGTVDPLIPPSAVEASAAQLPRRARLHAIAGGNHSGFAKHGLAAGDAATEMASQDQHFDLAVAATLHLLARVERGGRDRVSPGYAAAARVDQALGCAEPQLVTAGFTPAELPLEELNESAFATAASFAADASPSVNPPGSPLVNLARYLHPTAGTRRSSPSIIEGEMWCAMMTQEAIVALADDPPAPAGTQQECAAQNRRVLESVIAHLPRRLRTRAEAWTIDYQADRIFDSPGAAVLDPTAGVELRSGDADLQLTLSASGFEAGLDFGEWGPAVGQKVCTTLTRQRALDLALTLATTTQLANGGGSCTYVNPFTGDGECTHYSGEGWRVEAGEAACGAVFGPAPPVAGESSIYGCELEPAIGTCTVAPGTAHEQTTYYYDGDLDALEDACTAFLGGEWQRLRFDPLEVDGPFAVFEAEVAIPGPAGEIDGTIYAPSIDGGATPFAFGGPLPMSVVMPGFGIDYRTYAVLSRHLATHGIIAIGINFTDQANHPQNATEAIATIDWALTSGGPIAGLVDATRLATAGHSLGGKIAFFAASIDPRIIAVVGWDPVDSGGPPCSIDPVACNLWSIAPNSFDGDTGAMASINAAQLIFGAPIGPFNPVEHHADRFWEGTQADAQGPGHYIFFPAGDHGNWPDGPDEQRITKRTHVAWLLAAFDDRPDLAPYFDGGAVLQADVDAGTVTMQSKP